MRNNNISGKYRKNIERSKKEEQEHGPGKKDFVVCEKCGAVYHQKSWRHGFVDFKRLNENKNIQFALCPACEMMAEKKFEGKVVLENVPENHIGDIINNIKNTGDRAYKRDPMDRIIGIKRKGSSVEVLTTENQLARIIGQQVSRAYKKTKVDIEWSKEESAARVVVKFM